MNRVKSRKPAALLFFLALMAGGCSVLPPQQDRSRYFILMPASNSDSVAPAALLGNSRNRTVGLGPITIPRYLDRPEVITRLSETEISVSETDRWGEPLGSCVRRVLAQDLSDELPGLQFVPFPWSNRTQVDYRVSVDFRRLERTADGKAEVRAAWTVRTGADNKLVQAGATTVSESAGHDQKSASAALSRGVAQVSRQIAQALQKHFDTQAGREKQPRSFANGLSLWSPSFWLHPKCPTKLCNRPAALSRSRTRLIRLPVSDTSTSISGLSWRGSSFGNIDNALRYFRMREQS